MVQALRGALDRFERRVAAEVRDAPALRAEREPERDEPELVLLARQARQQRDRADAPAPAAREAEQATAKHAGREVLLGDRDLLALPARTEVAQVRKDDLGERCLDRGYCEHPVEDRLRRRLVEAVEGGCELGANVNRRERSALVVDHGPPASVAACAAASPSAR